MEKSKFKQEKTEEELLINAVHELIDSETKSLESSDVVATKLYYLHEFRETLEKLMFDEFNAIFENIKELYDLKGYNTCITEVISLGKRLEGYFDEIKKIDTEILSLIDDETEES